MHKTSAALLALLLFTASLHAQERPALGIDKALALAQAHLKSTGQDKDHWIGSIVLVPESMMRKSWHWFAKWEPAIDLGGRRELGLQINMDGSIARTVDKKGPK